MYHRKQVSIGLLVLSLALFAIQVGLWVHSVGPAHTETDKQNIEGHRPPTELPALLGSLLLIAAAAVVSIPPHVAIHKSHHES